MVFEKGETDDMKPTLFQIARAENEMRRIVLKYSVRTWRHLILQPDEVERLVARGVIKRPAVAPSNDIEHDKKKAIQAAYRERNRERLREKQSQYWAKRQAAK